MKYFVSRENIALVDCNDDDVVCKIKLNVFYAIMLLVRKTLSLA
jgi:hypothetical protein